MLEEFIKWKKCNSCEYLQHNSHLRCLRCKHEDFTVLSATGKCILISYTILKATPLEFRDQSSYALGIVEFENGIKALGQITTQDLKTGIELKPVIKKHDNEYRVLFEPLK